MRKMNLNTDVKLPILNALVVGIGLSDFETVLKIFLIIISIIYTLISIHEKRISIKKMKDGSDKFRENKDDASKTQK